jgi:hypothetical protein
MDFLGEHGGLNSSRGFNGQTGAGGIEPDDKAVFQQFPVELRTIAPQSRIS